MEKYVSKLSEFDTQNAIALVKEKFSSELCASLDLSRVSAPLFVKRGSGINDDLNGVERPVDFDIKETGEIAEVVHSLAKWKRMALMRYGFPIHTGLYTDMNAIRRDEICDNIHSIYVDQWDWEKVITAEDRNEEYLKATVRSIYGAILRTAAAVKEKYPVLDTKLPDFISFVSTYELEEKYPDMTPKERENAEDRLKYEFHTLLMNGSLPLTIGGGIGQSRLCMYLLQKAHIGEVQVSIWPEREVKKCKAAGIALL